MWKVKLNDGVWLAEGTTTAIEEKAWLFNDMPSVQAQLKKVRRLAPYPNAMVIAEFNQTQSISEQCTSLPVSDAIDSNGLKKK